MSKVKKIIFMLSLMAAAGVTWTIITLKNIPESFDWEDEDDS
jgi:hypothetical protein